MLGNLLAFSAVLTLYLDPFDWFGTSDEAAVDTPLAPTPPVEPGIFINLEGSDDKASGGAGNDTIFGLAGNDTLAGAEGADFIEGNTGDDQLLGQAGDDTLAGGAGTDQIEGGDGNDVLGSDRLDQDASFGRGGADSLLGGAGEDRLIFSSGDVVSGGDGTDRFELVIVSGEEPAQFQDFDDRAETLTIYYEPENGTETPPKLTTARDEASSSASIFLDGVEVAAFNSAVSFTEANLSLAPVEDLALAPPA